MEGGLITPPALIGTGPLMGVTSTAPTCSWWLPPAVAYRVRAGSTRCRECRTPASCPGPPHRQSTIAGAASPGPWRLAAAGRAGHPSPPAGPPLLAIGAELRPRPRTSHTALRQLNASLGARTASGTRSAYLLLFTDSRAPGDWATALGDGESVAGFDDLNMVPRTAITY